MKKTFYLLPIAMFLLAGCPGNEPTPEPAPGPTGNDGKSIETAFSADELIAHMAAFDVGDVDSEEYYVKLTFGTGTTYDTAHTSWSGYANGHDISAEKPVQIYSAQMDSSVIKNYRGDGCLDGATVVVCGYPQLYRESEGKPIIYEIGYLTKTKSPTGEAVSPTILSVEGGHEYVQPEATAIDLGDDIVMQTGKDKQLTLSLTPSDAKMPTVSYTTGDPAVATVSSTGVLHGAHAGTTTVTATSTTNPSITSTVNVRVTDSLPNVELTFTSLGLSKKSYADNDGEHEVEGITFVTSNVMQANKDPNLELIQFKANSEGTLLNSDAFPNAISSIVIEFRTMAYDGNTLQVELADGSLASTTAEESHTITTVKGTTKYTVTPTSTELNYFKLANSYSRAQYIKTITVNLAV